LTKPETNIYYRKKRISITMNGRSNPGQPIEKGFVGWKTLRSTGVKVVREFSG